ncbi:hypothetical protein UFOVP116_250 [uncultured Caudovirales phage]|uniref:Uncharacterized protein n=1 Tax=uncultured Caudovirales phage TaxID=2100421 RepID=A0A6J5L6M7_9CAUD|nr:hypothetical protein UFOVP116_250 [uncultured Caudovirales phage]
MIKIGDVVEPIPGCYNSGYMATVIKVIDNRLCVVRFTSPKVKPADQLRSIENLIKRS